MHRFKPLGVSSLVVVALSVGFVAVAHAAPENARWEEAWIESTDGVRLHADVYKPSGVPEPLPVILNVTPYATFYSAAAPSTDNEGHEVGYPDVVRRFLDAGYAYVQVDLRGYGSSAGCPDWGGPGEQADVNAAIEWAGTQPWSTGRVGMFGLSYDGWTAVMGLASHNPHLAAAVPVSAPTDPYLLTWTDEHISNDVNRWTLAPAYVPFMAAPAWPLRSPDEHAGANPANPHDPGCEVEPTVAGLDGKRDAAFWRERDLPSLIGATRVPTLLANGYLDERVHQTHFAALWPHLAGPKRAWLGQWGHGIPNAATADPAHNPAGRDGFVDETVAWFDRYVKVDKSVDVDAGIVMQEGNGTWHRETAWQPSDARYYDLPLKPGTYFDGPGNASQQAIPNVSPVFPVPTGRGVWTFTQPLPHDLFFSGTPRVDVDVDVTEPRSPVIAILYDVAPDGKATWISDGAALARVDGTLSFDMWIQDWRLKADHRIGLLVSGADDLWFQADHTFTNVTVRSGSLSLPFKRFEPHVLDGGPAAAMQWRPPIDIDARTIEDGTVPAQLPPPLKRRGA